MFPIALGPKIHIYMYVTGYVPTYSNYEVQREKGRERERKRAAAIATLNTYIHEYMHTFMALGGLVRTCDTHYQMHLDDCTLRR